MFRGHQVDEFMSVLFDQCLELEDHPGPALRVDRSPGGLRSLGNRDSLRQDCGVTMLQKSLHLSCARIINLAGDSASARDALAVDKVVNRVHGSSFLNL